jgi:hypothetical protein
MSAMGESANFEVVGLEQALNLAAASEDWSPGQEDSSKWMQASCLHL